MAPTTVNGLCVSVLDDSYQFSLTTNDTPPESIQACATFASTSPSSLDSTIPSLASKFANLNQTSKTFFCLPSTTSTVHLRCIMNLVPKLGLPQLNKDPIHCRKAYTASLSADDFPISIHFLQCSPESSAADLRDLEPNGNRILEIEHASRSINHSHTDDTSARAAQVLQELIMPFEDTRLAKRRIVILDTHSDMIDALKTLLETAIPAAPVYVATSADLSAALSHYTPPNPNDYPRTKTMAQYCMPLPISIATADGNAVVAVPGDRKLRPAEETIFLTTSHDNQTSVRLDIYLGDHLDAKDNLLSGSVVLEDLVPMPKGKTVIRAKFVVSHSTGTTVTVEQVLGKKRASSAPKVVAEFPHLIKYLGNDYERYEAAEGDTPAPFFENSETPVGDLPQA